MTKATHCGLVLVHGGSHAGDCWRRLILLACCVPEQGTAIVESMRQPLRAIVARAVRKGGSSKPLPGSVGFMCNGMNKENKAFVRARLYPEASGLSAQKVDRSGLPEAVPRTWILTLRDRALSPKVQRTYVPNLGGVEEVLELDTCHEAMVSEPAALVVMLEERCRLVERIDTEDAFVSP